MYSQYPSAFQLSTYNQQQNNQFNPNITPHNTTYSYSTYSDSSAQNPYPSSPQLAQSQLQTITPSPKPPYNYHDSIVPSHSSPNQ